MVLSCTPIPTKAYFTYTIYFLFLTIYSKYQKQFSCYWEDHMHDFTWHVWVPSEQGGPSQGEPSPARPCSSKTCHEINRSVGFLDLFASPRLAPPRFGSHTRQYSSSLVNYSTSRTYSLLRKLCRWNMASLRRTNKP